MIVAWPKPSPGRIHGGGALHQLLQQGADVTTGPQHQIRPRTQLRLEEQQHVLPPTDRPFLVDNRGKFSPQVHLHVLEEEMYHLAKF